MQTKPHNHTWRNKMLEAFQPPVRGSCFGLRGVPAMERSEWRCWQMERQGRVLVQLCCCAALLVPLSVWVLGLLLGQRVVDSSSTAPLQADLCTRAWSGICAAAEKEQARCSQLLQQKTWGQRQLEQATSSNNSGDIPKPAALGSHTAARECTAPVQNQECAQATQLGAWPGELTLRHQIREKPQNFPNFEILLILFLIWRGVILSSIGQGEWTG